MATVEKLPVVPGNSPHVYRREHVGDDAYAEVRTVTYGIAPIAVVKDGPVDLKEAMGYMDETRKRDVEGWIVLTSATKILRSIGHRVTVYGGGGTFLIDGWKRIVPATADDADQINATVDGFLNSGKRFIAVLNGSLGN